MTELQVKVAISSDFLTAFAKIPRAQQAKVMRFIEEFRKNPMSPGINYEKINDAKDKNLRSVRIDQAYRGIILKPASGNVYALLWVDHHDDAYDWARRHVVTINPELGSLQILESTTVESVSAVEVAESEMRLFSGIADKHLRRFGVPESLLPTVRQIDSVEALEETESQLPEEAYEGLYLTAAGYTLQEVYSELERPETVPQVDTEDFASALDNEDSKRRFYVVEDDLELQAMLAAPLEKWRVFLHPTQRKLIERDWNGPARVLGGAGTGKTVVAMHRAKWLAENRLQDKEEKILFTTFTRNLAADIQQNLSKICAPDILQRIEIINLDKWVLNYLRKSGYEHEIDYGKKTKDLWENSLTLLPSELELSEEFYREEWEKIIQPHGLSTEVEYLRISRIGRGTKLSRKQRKQIWPVFEEYRIQLNEYGLKEPEDAIRDARLILEQKNQALPYRSVIVDEAQDMGSQAFMLIRQLISSEGKNDLFIVGDGHQRIYRHKVVLSQCGINIRGRSKRLRINYRTTEETRRWAIQLLEGHSIDDLDGGVDEQKGYKSLMHGVKPEVRKFDSVSQELEYLVNYLKHVELEVGDLTGVCLVARTNALVTQYQKLLNNNGIETYLIRRSESEDRSKAGVRLATMHRVKGLEFERVIVASANDGIIPYSGCPSSSDPVIKKETDLQERALLYVSATRARKEVIITSSGMPSKFLF